MNQTRLTVSLLAVCIFLSSLTAHAVSLGKLTAVSGLGEPLIAEIDISDINLSELSVYSAQLASEQAYLIQGIKKTPEQSGIKIDVIKKYDGSPVLKITSTQPISNSALNLLVQLDWPNGRVLKEYLLLLESLSGLSAAPIKPPTTPSKPAGPLIKSVPTDVLTNNTPRPKVTFDDIPPLAETTAKAEPSKAEVAKAESAKSEPVKAEARKSEPAEKQTSATDTQDYVASKGEVLGKIAQQIPHEGVRLEDLMRQIYEANKDAFLDGDMNRLKVGATLKLPKAVGPQADVAVKSDNWDAYRHKVAGMTSELTGDGNTATQPEKIKPKVEEKAPRVASRDVLKLSSSERISDQSLSRIAQLEQEKQGLEEELTVSEKKLAEANSRISELQQQVADLKKLADASNGVTAAAPKQPQTSALLNFYKELKSYLNQPSDSVLLMLAFLLVAALLLLMHLFSNSKPKPLHREEPSFDD